MEKDIMKYLKRTILFLNHYKKLSSLQNKVIYLSKNENSSLHSFRKFVENGLSRRELLTLCTIKELIKIYVTDLSGLLQHADGWREYGEYSKVLNEFMFSPERKLKELKRKYKFQCMIAESQLLANYFEEKKIEHFSNMELKVRKGKIIAEWLFSAWCKFKKKKDEEKGLTDKVQLEL